MLRLWKTDRLSRKQGCNASTPVFAAPRTSRPVSRWGMVRACTSVMCWKPISAIALCVCSVRSSEENSAALIIPLTRAVTRSTSTPFFACKRIAINTHTLFSGMHQRYITVDVKYLLGAGCCRSAIYSPAACCCLLGMLPCINCVFLGYFDLLRGLGCNARSGCLYEKCKAGVTSMHSLNMLCNLLLHKTQDHRVLRVVSGCAATQGASHEAHKDAPRLPSFVSFLVSFSIWDP